MVGGNKMPRTPQGAGAVAHCSPGRGNTELFDVQIVIPRSGRLQQGGSRCRPLWKGLFSKIEIPLEVPVLPLDCGLFPRRTKDSSYRRTNGTEDHHRAHRNEPTSSNKWNPCWDGHNHRSAGFNRNGHTGRLAESGNRGTAEKQSAVQPRRILSASGDRNAGADWSPPDLST